MSNLKSREHNQVHRAKMSPQALLGERSAASRRCQSCTLTFHTSSWFRVKQVPSRTSTFSISVLCDALSPSSFPPDPPSLPRPLVVMSGVKVPTILKFDGTHWSTWKRKFCAWLRTLATGKRVLKVIDDAQKKYNMKKEPAPAAAEVKDASEAASSTSASSSGTDDRRRRRMKRMKICMRI